VIANLVPLEAIATMGSAGFLLVFTAVNVANLRLARQTASRRWISAAAALSTGLALLVLCVEVHENPATRRHLWILAGMILTSFCVELVYRGITGRRIRLARRAPGADALPALD
jgi:ABC-type iron transport system FetAB permease component